MGTVGSFPGGVNRRGVNLTTPSSGGVNSCGVVSPLPHICLHVTWSELLTVSLNAEYDLQICGQP
jgi:hypothetical protein